MIVDASVAVKWFVPEPGSDRAEVLLAPRQPLVAPDLILPETLSALWKALRRRIVTEDAYAAAAAALPRMFGRLMPAVHLVVRAASMAKALDHSPYDCIYLALAEAEGDVLVTADMKFLETLEATPWAGLARAL